MGPGGVKKGGPARAKGGPARVLVLGAAGGVGSLAAQLAARAGAEVVAVGSTGSQGRHKVDPRPLLRIRRVLARVRIRFYSDTYPDPSS